MQSFDDILNDLKKKIYRPVYFLSGEEPYYIDLISDYIEENFLQPEEKEFNQSVIYGRDTNVEDIIFNCKRYPMMSNYQVVIVKEAQDVKKIEELEKYVENPMESTILVICYKYTKIDKRKTFAKLLDKKAVFFDSPQIYDNQVQGWITSYLNTKGYRIGQKASFLMAENLGNDLSKIVNEVSKIIINIPAGTEITPEHIELNIGISKDYNVFELQKALASKNVFKANQIIRYFAENEKENPMIKTLPILYTFFVKVLLYYNVADKSSNNLASVLSVNRMFLDDYATAARNYSLAQLRRVFHLLHQFDIRCKGVDNASTSDGELMKELIYGILH